MISSVRKSLLLTMVLAVAASTALSAQPVRGSRTDASRPELEQQFRQRLAKLAQTRIGLTDAQMAQLEQSSARYAPQLSDLATQERETRRQLRVELTATQPNQQHVSDLLDASLRLQKQRIALIEAEQKDLGRFMTPVQRARYIALQQQFRRRTQELTAKRGGGQRPGGKRLP
jgi:protein CpxP